MCQQGSFVFQSVHACVSLCVCFFRERFSVHARLCLSATVCSKASSRETKRGHINTQLDWADVVWWECYGGHPLLQQRWISRLYKAFCKHTLTLTLTICWMTYDRKPTSGIKTDVRLHCTQRQYTLRYWLKTRKSRRCIFYTVVIFWMLYTVSVVENLKHRYECKSIKRQYHQYRDGACQNVNSFQVILVQRLNERHENRNLTVEWKVFVFMWEQHCEGGDCV